MAKGSSSSVRRWGHNRAGTQRYRCLACRRNFTPAPKEQGHGAALHEQAVRFYLEGMSLRAIGRLLGVVHQSVANWVAAAGMQLPEAVADAAPTETVEVDELLTFVGRKKGGRIHRDRGGAGESADRRGVGDTGLRYAGDAGDGGGATGGIALLHGWIRGLPGDHPARCGVAFRLDREGGDLHD
jgi:hypothetical protein